MKAWNSPFNTWRAIKPATASSESKKRSLMRRNGRRAATTIAASTMNVIARRRLAGVHKRVEHADAELARIVALEGIDLRGREGLVHPDLQLRHVGVANLGCRNGEPPELPILGRDGERVHDLI